MSIDLTKLSMEFQIKPVYSLVSVAWSTLADVTVGAENFRFLGDSRFQLYGAYRVINLMQK